MNEQNLNETWQVDAGGQVYETNFAEMTAWIAEGSLLPQDKVRRGNLRWIEARKVPSLVPFFNARVTGSPAPVVVSTTDANGPVEAVPSHAENFAPANNGNSNAAELTPSFTPHDLNQQGAPANTGFCVVHADVPAAFACDTCANAFCKACPNSYGGTVKICPFCGAMCKSLEQIQKIQRQEMQYQTAMGAGFGAGDFFSAVAFPFKFKSSLFIGAIMFMFFTLGQSASSFGGIFMLAAAIFCFMLANMLTFGILANTVENFSQGKLDSNFMPSFDDFSLWDDVVHPFFLSIGVYISSFGPLILVMIIAVYMMIGAVKSEISSTPASPSVTGAPPLPYDQRKTADQSKAVKDLVEKFRKQNEKNVAIQNGELPPDELNEGQMQAVEEEQEIARVQEMIQQNRQAQLESVVGKTPETRAAENEQFLTKLVGYGAIFLLLAGVCLIWGVFYFPAACAVAGYTRSFAATLNPLVGLDTIKRLGLTYFKILVMSVLILVASGIVSMFLSLIFIPFDLPGVGNIPAKAVGSLFTFYFSIVFSCILGYALFKASDRLKLYR